MTRFFFSYSVFLAIYAYSGPSTSPILITLVYRILPTGDVAISLMPSGVAPPSSSNVPLMAKYVHRKAMIHGNHQLYGGSHPAIFSLEQLVSQDYLNL